MNELVRISREVRGALRQRRPVVALETTLVAHGFPRGTGLEVGLEAELRVRGAGAVPATVGVLDGEVRVGLTAAELQRFDETARKVGPRDLAACAVQGAIGATTVGGTLAVCRVAGIGFMGTGGIGGVHRDWTTWPDVSADLGELAHSEVLVVSSGVKSLLDMVATSEMLETLGIPVLGWRTDELPAFYTPKSALPVPARVETAEEAARIAKAHWALGRRSAIVLANPPATPLYDIGRLVDEAVADAVDLNVQGQAVTPHVLEYLHEHSAGRTLQVNRRLIVDNAALAAEVAVAYAGLS